MACRAARCRATCHDASRRATCHVCTVQGLAKPVDDLSRGCTVPDVINAICVTSIQVGKRTVATVH